MDGNIIVYLLPVLIVLGHGDMNNTNLSNTRIHVHTTVKSNIAKGDVVWFQLRHLAKNINYGSPNGLLKMDKDQHHTAR